MPDSNYPPIPVILGQTASGKTAVSLVLARLLDAEIIMADSMAVYRGMDIGTAKPTSEERALVAHHCVDIVDANVNFSVADYIACAKAAIDDIRTRGKRPLIVCGTGLYLKALLEGLAEVPEGDEKLRARLWKAEEDEPGAVYEQLKQLDPVSAERIHPHNAKRLIRALEVCIVSGEPFSSFAREDAPELVPNIKFGLRRDKKELYARIGDRVDAMFDAGLINEVRTLLDRYGRKLSVTARQAIGYKEVIDHLNGKASAWATCDEVKRSTRLYAKRQMTWFSRQTQVEWIDLVPDSDPEAIARSIAAKL